MSSEESEESSAERGWSVLVWAVGLVALGFVLGYQVVFTQLDQPYVKRWLNSYLSLPHDIIIDYHRLELAPLAGRLQIEGLKVSSPSMHRHHVPLLLELERLSVQWSTRSLFTKEIRVDHIEVENLRLTDVAQEHGPSTWDLVGEGASSQRAPSESPEPLSKAARLDWLPRAVQLNAVSVGDLAWARTELDSHGTPLRRLELRGLRLALDGLLKPGHAAAHMRLTSSLDDAPTRLTILDIGSRHSALADLQVAVAVRLSESRSVEFSAVADLLAQTIDPSVAVSGRVVDIEGAAEFAADAGTTRAVVKRFEVLQGAVSAEFSAELSDHSLVPRLVGSGHAHLDPLLKIKAGLLPGWDGRAMEVNGRFMSDRQNERAIHVEVAARAGEVQWRPADGQSLDLEHLSVDVRGTIDPDKGGNVMIGAPVSQVTYRDGNGRMISVKDVTVRLESPVLSFDVHHPSSAAGTISAATLLVGAAPHPRQRVFEQANFQWNADDVKPHDSIVPVSGRLRINGAVDDVTVAVTAWASDEEAEAEVALKTDRLGTLAHWLPELESQGITVAQTGLDMSVAGRYRHLTRAETLELGHTVAATLTRVAVRRPGASVELPAIELHAQHSGRNTSHSARLEVDFGRIRVNGVAGDRHPRLTANARRAGTAVTVQAEFKMDPAVALSIQGNFEAQSGVLTHRSRLAIDRPREFGTWLPKPMQEQYPIDWSQFTASLLLEGSINGLLTMRADHAVPELTGRPLHEVTAEQSLTLDLHHVVYRGPATAVDVPHGRLRAAGTQRAGRVTGRLDVDAPDVAIIHNGEELKLASMKHHALFGADALHLADGDVGVRMASEVQQVTQSYAPSYPVSDVTITGRAHISRLESFIIDDLTIQNKGGGTHITLSKSLNRAAPAGGGGPSPAQKTSPSLRELTLSGTLTQTLEELSSPAGAFHGHGVITAPLTVYSSDGMLFNIAASMHMDNVSLTVPEAGLQLEALSGRIHLDETLEWDSDDGITVVHDSERNHFSSSRYQDAQPFLANQSFFKIGTLRWHDRTMGPIIGSLHVKNNVFALSKLKIQKEQGTISGQLIFDYYPGAEQITFRGNVTGVRVGKSKEPLDGNMAFVFVPGKLELDGRIQILRLSRQHLEDMLDLLDPFREDGGLNRLRFALAFGYPNFARMEMAQGLAALKVELGGIGRLLTVGEIRGIALGPFMTRHVEPLLRRWADSQNGQVP